MSDFTDNFLFPLLPDGSSNWGAVINAMLEVIDIELKAAQTPISNRTPDILIVRSSGEVLLQHFQL